VKYRKELELDNIQQGEIEPFVSSLTTELNDFGGSIVGLLEQLVYLKGIWREGQLVGIGGIQRSRICRGIFLVSHIVKEDFQRQGVGSELNQAFERYIKQANIPVVFSLAFNTNIACLSMNKKDGFKVICSGKESQLLYLALDRKGDVIAHLLIPLFKIYELSGLMGRDV